MNTKDISSAVDKISWVHQANNCGPISLPCIICGRGIHADPWVTGVYVVDKDANQWEVTDDPTQGVAYPVGWNCWRANREILEGMVFLGLKGEKARMLR